MPNYAVAVFMVREMEYLNLVLISLSFSIMPPLSATSAACDTISNLKKLIPSRNDPQMSTQGLTLFLAIHNYYFAPKESYAEHGLWSQIRRLIPIANMQGFCEMARTDSKRE